MSEVPREGQEEVRKRQGPGGKGRHGRQAGKAAVCMQKDAMRVMVVRA